MNKICGTVRSRLLLVGLVACFLVLPPALVLAQEVTQPLSPSLDPELIRRLVDQRVKELDEQRKAEEKKSIAPQPCVECPPEAHPGNPKLSAEWDNGLFLVSPNKDWRIHVGGRMEFNSVWWQQPADMRGPPPVNGIPAANGPAGVGPLDDGTYFRRVRFRADGTGYEKVEFMMEVDFENLNFIAFDHMWVGMKDIPLLGTVRVGQHKVPQGLDMVGSDYYLTFLERSVLSEAFLTLFAPGVYISNTYFDKNVTAHAMFHRLQPLQFYDGAAFGDGNYAATTRATWTPLYASEGAEVVHLGISYQWRTGNLGRTIAPIGTGNAFLDTQNVVRFRARPELRDAVGIISPVIGGSSARFIDTGFFLAESVQTINPEFMVNWGPLNFRAEAAIASVDRARTVSNNALVSSGSPLFWGSYTQVSYFLTGEHWGYDRRSGVYDRPKVKNNAFFAWQDGKLAHGLGAWEVAYRFSYADLNNNGINGGQLTQHTVGLNWYLNDNTRFQFNYLNAQRDVILPAVSGTVHGVGVQAQWYF